MATINYGALKKQCNLLQNKLRLAEQERDELRRDAERYRWLKRYNRLDGWNDENIDRDIAIEAAIFAQTGAEVK